MQSLPITSLAAIANGLLFLALTYNVIFIRRRDKIVLGDNGDRIVTKAIRGQANAAEQIPLALILMGLIEVQGGGGVILGLLALVFTLGRVSHAAYFTRHGTHFKARFYGMMATLITQAGLLLCLTWVVLFG